MQDQNFILEFDQAQLTPRPGQAAMAAVTLQLRAGEIVIVRVEPGNEQLPLADAALGLETPARGRVLFQDADWRTVAAEQALRLRARIGRVFDRDGWVSNLDILENITLAQRHHTRRPIAEIAAEAQTLARQFGLPAVPPGRPAAVPHRDLRRAEWVRAWMGRPDLVCLERPGRGVATEHIARLAAGIRQVCARGGAALWLTDDDREIQAAGGETNVRHYKMQGTMLMKV